MACAQDSGARLFVTKPAQLVIEGGFQGLGQVIQGDEMLRVGMGEDRMVAIKIAD